MKIETIVTSSKKSSYHSSQVNKFIEDNIIKVITIDSYILQGFSSARGVYESKIVTIITYEENRIPEPTPAFIPKGG